MRNIIADKVAVLLLNQNIHRLPINPLKIKYEYDIKFDTIESYIKNSTSTRNELDGYIDLVDGITIKKGNLNIILFNESVKNLGRVFFTIAHELGHIYLCHNCDNEKEELEADMFAAEFLMPRILIGEILSKDSDAKFDLFVQTFGTSNLAIKRRISECKYEYNPSENEINLLEIYKNFLPRSNGPIITI